MMEDGVWRTVGGRRIFIKNGESLGSAMKRSGKFKSKKDKKLEEDAKTLDEMSERNKQKEKEQFNKDLERYNEMSQEERIDKFISGKKWNDWSDEEQKEGKETKKMRDVKDYQDEKGRWHINDTAKNEIDKEVSMMSGKDLKEAYNSLEKNDNSYEARSIRGEYNQRRANEEKFHKTTESMAKGSQTSDESFTMTNGDKTVTVSKDDSGKWVDSDGNKYMGYLSKSDVKSYFKGDWREAKTSESSKKGSSTGNTALDKSTSGLNKIDKIAGNDEKLQRLGREMGSNSFERWSKSYETYKKEHPNSKIDLYKFIKMNKD